MTQRAQVVDEVPIWLEVNGERHATWTATPADLEALSIGRLLADGYIDGAADVEAVDISRVAPAGSIRVRAQVADSTRGRQRRQHLAEHGCGVLGLVTCLDAFGGGAVRRGALPSPERIAGWQRALFDAEAALRAERGGMHAAGIVSGGELGAVAFDVGRHNAVDKAIGAALRADIELSDAGIVLSARISGEIAAKAGIARVAWVASRSIPTSLALAIARAAGTPLVARAGSAEPVTHGA